MSVDEFQGDNAGLIAAEVELDQPYRASRLNGGSYRARYFQHAEDYSGRARSLLACRRKSDLKLANQQASTFEETNSVDGDNSVIPATLIQREFFLVSNNQASDLTELTPNF